METNEYINQFFGGEVQTEGLGRNVEVKAGLKGLADSVAELVELVDKFGDENSSDMSRDSSKAMGDAYVKLNDVLNDIQFAYDEA